MNAPDPVLSGRFLLAVLAWKERKDADSMAAAHSSDPSVAGYPGPRLENFLNQRETRG